MRRTMGVCAVLLLMLVSYGMGRIDTGRGDVGAADGDCQTFTQTGKSACGEFLTYWKANGGLAQQGFPISEVFSEQSETDGKTYQVQYFERAVFEIHPEHPAGKRVLLTLLGSQKYKTRYNGTQPSGTLVVTSATAVAPTAAPTATAPAPTPAAAATNRRTGGDLAITLWTVRDDASTGNGFKPDAGYRCLTLDITVENTGSGKIGYNALNGLVKATDDRQYEANALCGDAKPRVSYGDLGPGEKIRAWEFFEVPTDAKIASFVWKGQNDSTITFPL